MSDALPIRHVVPLGSENRWCDLLSALIEADPAPVAALLGLGEAPRDVRVRREVRASGRDRIDLEITADGEVRCVVEAKVLAGLGLRQLRRYSKAFEHVATKVVVYPRLLPVHVGSELGWQERTWEQLLEALAASGDRWVACTSAQWLSHLDGSMPHVIASTRWNDLVPGEDFVIAMRARMSWVYGQLNLPKSIRHDLVGSAAGVSWVARMYLPAAVAGYWIYVEAEEYLPVRDYPARAGTGRNPLGPSIKVTVQQSEVQTSANFDWDYLLAMWPAMQDARSDWVQNAASPPSAHDRTAWKMMVAKGGPKYLGIGFGDAQARKYGDCMFGARIQLPADVTLQEVVDAMQQMTDLMLRMAEVAQPVPTAGVDNPPTGKTP